MNSKRSAIPCTGTLFEQSEYERRQYRVLEAVERAGFDALLVTAQSHLRYLTGYSGTGAYFGPFPLILAPGREPTFVVRKFDEENVRAFSCIDEIVPYTHGYEFRTVCGDVLRRLKLHNKRIGMELGCWSLAPADVAALRDELPDLKIADASRLVASVAAVKSEVEIQALHEAAIITDLAIGIFHRSLREGATEAEVFAAIRSGVETAGGELSAGLNLAFGERLLLPHARPVSYPMEMNNAAFIELSATVKDYCAPVCRSAVLGRHQSLETLHKVAEEAIEAAVEAIKPGTTTGAVSATIRRVVERGARPEALRSRTGYQIGVYWSDRGDLSIEPTGDDVIEVDMSFHMPIILFDEEGYQIGCSETVLVTRQGAKILSKTPHTLYRA
ncbi:M24 family metallopeptidase [Mesorhizobium humile]|uniref:Xaa-Pro peptidase family protein n=1 Tax=Mesorhizobium humile TaxID=3072313 RepID=A0ABU4YL36_9HYPH|nr:MULTISPECIES: Xaa-Pro peptidase family protein [unclassified Mesorhizobium]MDX8462484.1 Xaa-Pro peptidase family protein [Mesorhizobium sp. VK2D]MDX8487680.1 Xaa-Pro peptidase family protein [Mesorhizobium sp. VK2B]